MRLKTGLSEQQNREATLSCSLISTLSSRFINFTLHLRTTKSELRMEYWKFSSEFIQRKDLFCVKQCDDFLVLLVGRSWY